MSELVDTLLSFATPVAIALIGAHVAFRYQQYSWKMNRNEERIRIQKAQAQEILDALSSHIDRRIFAIRRLALEVSAGHVRSETLENFRSKTFEWNENITRMKTGLSVYFGDYEMERLEYDINNIFTKYTSTISIAIHADPESARPLARGVLEGMNKFGYRAFRFTKHLADRIRREEVGTIQHLDDIYKAQIHDISFAYLLGRLLNLRKRSP